MVNDTSPRRASSGPSSRTSLAKRRLPSLSDSTTGAPGTPTP
jgi:hypothetical protein